MSQSLQESRKYLLCARERSTGGGVAELVALLCQARPDAFIHHPIGRSADRGWGAVLSDPQRLLRRLADPSITGVVLHPSIRPRALARDAILARCVLAARKPLFVWWHGMDRAVASAARFAGLRAGIRRSLGQAAGHYVLTEEARDWVMEVAAGSCVHRLTTCWDPAWLGGRRADPAGEGPWLYLGRLHRRKGVWTAARAVAGVPGARLVIAGDGPEAGRLARWCKREGLEDRIVCVGHVVGQEKAGHVLGARGLLLPSLGEGAPLAVVEAMAAGLPVIASSVGAVPDLVGAAGCLVEPGDEDGFVKALDVLHRSPEERRRRGELGAERAAGWTSHRVADHWFDLLGRRLHA